MNYIKKYNESVLNEGYARIIGGLASGIKTIANSRAAQTAGNIYGKVGTKRRAAWNLAGGIGAYTAADPIVTKGFRAAGWYDPKSAEADNLASKMKDFENRQQSSINDLNKGTYNPLAVAASGALGAGKVAGVAMGAAAVVGGGIYAAKAISNALQRRKWATSKCNDVSDELEKKRCIVYNNNIAINNLTRTIPQCGQDEKCKAKIQAQIDKLLSNNQG